MQNAEQPQKSKKPRFILTVTLVRGMVTSTANLADDALAIGLVTLWQDTGCFDEYRDGWRLALFGQLVAEYSISTAHKSDS